MRDREATDLADMLLEAPADVERTPRLDQARHPEDVATGDSTDVPGAKHGKGVALEPGQKSRGMSGVKSTEPVGVPVARDRLEGPRCGLERPATGSLPSVSATLASARRGRAWVRLTSG